MAHPPKLKSTIQIETDSKKIKDKEPTPIDTSPIKPQKRYLSKSFIILNIYTLEKEVFLKSEIPV